jgi:hypothetical protein
LRFKSSGPSKLTRTPGSSSATLTKLTYSGWIKRGTLGTYQSIYGGYIPTGPTNDCIRFNSSDEIDFNIVGGSVGYFNTAMKFRDTSAWYHIVAVVDTTQATARNRMRMWVNGVEINPQSNVLNPAPPQNTTLTGWNNASRIQNVGTDTDGSSFPFDGYMADVYSIDGQALDPSYFGQTSAITGVWEPKQYSGTYGTNGFHLEFKDTTVGKDTSGNNNHWTPNNISTTNDTTYDLMLDVPTQWAPRDGSANVRGNYATLNPVGRAYGGNSNYGSFTNGNLSFATTGNPSHAWGTMEIPSDSSQGYYWEAVCTSMDNARTYVGLMDPTAAISASSDGASYSWPYKYLWERSGYYFNNLQTDGNNSGRGQLGGGYAANDVVMIAYKNGSLWFGKNGTWIDSANPAAGTGFLDNNIDTTKKWLPYFGYNSNWTVNFGQRPFTYTPPAGFKSLCTTNLPTPTIGATVATAANKYFDATLYTGTGATLSVTNAGGFQPDFVWLKSRSAVTNHQLFDAVRGATKVLTTSVLTEAEQTAANTLTSFNSSGFTIGTNTAINTSSSTYVGWQWKAGSSTVTNTTGTISAQVCANPTTGFSIITYAGNSTDFQTVGHGLGITPQMVIVKGRTSTNYWPVWHTSLPSFTYNLYLNTTDNQQSDGQFTSTSSTTVGVRNGGSTNQVGTDFLMYCWAPIAGYSAFGSYTGNGSANGPFVYTGFKPRFIMIKRFDGGVTSWYIVDTAINTYNEALKTNYPNLANAEGTNANFCDFLSNGFKIRESGIAASGASYLYAAWAENPFKNSLAR